MDPDACNFENLDFDELCYLAACCIAQADEIDPDRRLTIIVRTLSPMYDGCLKSLCADLQFACDVAAHWDYQIIRPKTTRLEDEYDGLND